MIPRATRCNSTEAAYFLGTVTFNRLPIQIGSTAVTRFITPPAYEWNQVKTSGLGDLQNLSA